MKNNFYKKIDLQFFFLRINSTQKIIMLQRPPSPRMKKKDNSSSPRPDKKQNLLKQRK